MTNTLFARNPEVATGELNLNQATIENLSNIAVVADQAANLVFATREVREMEFAKGVRVDIVTLNKGNVVLDCDNQNPLYFTTHCEMTGKEVERKTYRICEDFITVELGMNADNTGLGFKTAIKTNSDGRVTSIVYVLKTFSDTFNPLNGDYQQVELEDIRQIKNRFMSLTQEEFKALV